MFRRALAASWQRHGVPSGRQGKVAIAACLRGIRAQAFASAANNSSGAARIARSRSPVAQMQHMKRGQQSDGPSSPRTPPPFPHE